MKIFAIIGYTNSGKTKTLVEIIKELIRRGKTVNTVKAIHIEGFSVDTEGKDSWRHQQAGAKVTAIRSDVETALLFQKSMSAKELIPFFNADYLIFEGFTKEKDVPKILCSTSLEDIDERFNQTVFAISGVISKTLKEFKNVKVINGLTSTKELVDLIEKRSIKAQKLLDL